MIFLGSLDTCMSCRQDMFCQQHTVQNPYLLCMWLVVCQEINIRNHLTEIYRCSEIKEDKVSCPRDRAETGCHDTELSSVTRDCCWSHYKAVAPVSPPTQSPAAPATTPSPCSVLITCKNSHRILKTIQRIFMEYLFRVVSLAAALTLVAMTIPGARGDGYGHSSHGNKEEV